MKRLLKVYNLSSKNMCEKLVGWKSLLIDREIWLVRGSYCHCQQVMAFFWSSTYSLGEVVIQNGNLLTSGVPL